MMQSPAQVSLRPNNRLSDMQAIMEQTQAFENRVLERLNAGKTVRSFLIAAVELLTEAVNILVLQVFSQRRLRGKVCCRTVTGRRRTAGRFIGTAEADLRAWRAQPSGV